MEEFPLFLIASEKIVKILYVFFVYVFPPMFVLLGPLFFKEKKNT